MKCLQCGKEIPEGRKFCSSSCSAKYNNLRRERKPWTPDQHLKNKKTVSTCRYCGKPGKRVCDDCRPFVQRVRTFNRLKIEGETLRDKNQALVNLLKDLYFNKHLSLQEIWEKTGLRYRQVEIIFHSAGIQLRSASKAQKEAIVRGRRGIAGSLEKRGIRGYHITYEGLKVYYRSSYELRFAKILDEKQIPYRMEDKRVRTKYWDSELQKERVAVPDFYLPDTNEIIEVKSSYTLGSIQRMRDKFKAYENAGFHPKLWLNWEFTDLNTL